MSWTHNPKYKRGLSSYFHYVRLHFARTRRSLRPSEGNPQERKRLTSSFDMASTYRLTSRRVYPNVATRTLAFRGTKAAPHPGKVNRTKKRGQFALALLKPFSFRRRRNIHLVAIFCHGSSRYIDACLDEFIGDKLITQRLFRIFFVDHILHDGLDTL